jgi:hypothetical protein
MNTQFRADSLESKLFALGQTAFEALSDNDIYNRFPECFPSGRNNGRAWNARKRVADATGWVMRSRGANAGKANSALEHKCSMGISANFQSSWKVHQSIVKDMPDLFSSEVPEKIINHDARNWLQDSLLSAAPNQFALTCSLASNQTALESDYRMIGVESKAMRESRLAAERAQRERDAIYISGLERQGFIVISPDNTVPTGIAASLNRLETIVAGMVEKSAELAELKASHKKLSGGIDKLTGDDLVATRAKLSGIESECSSLAERIRRANESSVMIASVDHAGNLVSLRERIGAWIDVQEQTIAKFGPLANKTGDIASKVMPPSQQFTPEQETKIAGVMTALDCSRDEAIATMKAKGKL